MIEKVCTIEAAYKLLQPPYRAGLLPPFQLWYDGPDVDKEIVVESFGHFGKQIYWLRLHIPEDPDPYLMVDLNAMVTLRWAGNLLLERRWTRIDTQKLMRKRSK